MNRPDLPPLAVRRRHATHRLNAALLSALLAGIALAAFPPARAQNSPGAAARQVVTRADQLPRRTVRLERLPSELLQAPLPELLVLADRVEADLRADLAQYDIQDMATLRGIESTLASLALLRGRWQDLPGHAQRLRELTEKPSQRASTGVLLELLAEVNAAGTDEGARARQLTARVAQRYGALDWADAQDSIKGLKASMETANPAVMVGALQSQLDTVARNGDMVVPVGVLAGVLGARAQLERILPLRQAIVAGLSPVVQRQMAAQPERPDRWSGRTVDLAASERATPVTVAIWDSGVDMGLFKPAAARGMAFDAQGHPVPDLLRPLGEAAARWPKLRDMAKGSMDLQAGLDTEDARRFRALMAGLKPEDVKAFMEDASLVSLYVHGTHVGGIAVDGNPFARVYPVSMHFGHTFPPPLPTAEGSQRVAANYRAIVKGMQAAGVRVVNMSWRYSPAAIEGQLTVHGAGRDAADRQRLARELFALERDALRDAIAGAPEILFVAGSGNENNSADFSEYIPGGFELPNLVTVGASDRAGDETGFSTFGRTVVLHANGFEVDSLIPGGEHMKISGASMAAPQVTNLAAKLLALDASLTPLQLKSLILDHAERRGRVNLVNPRASVQALRQRLG